MDILKQLQVSYNEKTNSVPSVATSTLYLKDVNAMSKQLIRYSVYSNMLLLEGLESAVLSKWLLKWAFNASGAQCCCRACSSRSICEYSKTIALLLKLHRPIPAFLHCHRATSLAAV